MPRRLGGLSDAQINTEQKKLCKQEVACVTECTTRSPITRETDKHKTAGASLKLCCLGWHYYVLATYVSAGHSLLQFQQSMYWL